MTRRTGVAAGWAIAVLLVLGGCSDNGGGDGGDLVVDESNAIVPQSTLEMSAPPPVPGGSDDAAADRPLVDEIAAAIAALEAELGGEQQYFEINATPKLVNLFVALNGGAVVQPWVYLDGELSSVEGQPATGGTFHAADLTFDPAAVLTGVSSQVPDATLDSFVINGDGEGNVQYEVLVTSAKGGALSVIVGPDGAVLSVDPIT